MQLGVPDPPFSARQGGKLPRFLVAALQKLSTENPAAGGGGGHVFSTLLGDIPIFSFSSPQREGPDDFGKL